MSVSETTSRPAGKSVAAAVVALVVTLAIFVIVFLTFLIAPLVALAVAFVAYAVGRSRRDRPESAGPEQPPSDHNGFGAGVS